jgi:hypothetical protein
MSDDRLPPSLVKALVDCAEKDSQAIASLLSGLVKREGQILFPEDLRERVKDAKPETDDVDGFVDFLIQASLHFGDQDFEATKRQIDNSSPSNISPQTRNALHQLAQIVTLDSINHVSKQLVLAYDQPATLMDARIIIDARPVFRRDRSEVVSYVLVSQIKLHFGRGAEREALFLQADKHDIERLQKACLTALKKIDRLSSDLANRMRVPVYLPGVSKAGDAQGGGD